MVFMLFFFCSLVHFGSSIHFRKSFRLLCPRKKVKKWRRWKWIKKMQTFIFGRLFPFSLPLTQWNDEKQISIHSMFVRLRASTLNTWNVRINMYVVYTLHVYMLRFEVHGARRLWFVFLFYLNFSSSSSSSFSSHAPFLESEIEKPMSKETLCEVLLCVERYRHSSFFAVENEGICICFFWFFFSFFFTKKKLSSL